MIFLCGHHYGSEVINFAGDAYDFVKIEVAEKSYDIAINALDNLKK